MTEHYYTNKPSTASNPQNINFTLRGNVLQFKSDRGVFSKNEVDFGSRLLIETFQFPTIEGDLLDVGCGYGPIGLALAKDCSERNIEMIDVNERAIDLAKQNAANNEISNVEIYKSDVFNAVNLEKKFAAILSNPPIRAGKKVVHQILEDSYQFLLPKGELWIVIQKKQGAPSAIEKLESIFVEVEIVERDKGYFIIRAIRD
ncbi:class I SAM-dependent methyltransferase [Cytobacillus suaedae]|nr:class I SAM-dependent methyltransferase [Cytobacillus suaedae]